MCRTTQRNIRDDLWQNYYYYYYYYYFTQQLLTQVGCEPMLTCVQIQHVKGYRLEASFLCKLSNYRYDINETTYVGMQYAVYSLLVFP
jgi:hypothetical protein